MSYTSEQSNLITYCEGNPIAFSVVVSFHKQDEVLVSEALAASGIKTRKTITDVFRKLDGFGIGVYKKGSGGSKDTRFIFKMDRHLLEEVVKALNDGPANPLEHALRSVEMREAIKVLERIHDIKVSVQYN